MLSTSHLVRRFLTGAATMVTLSFTMLSDSASQETREQELPRAPRERALELIKAKGLSPHSAMEVFLASGSKTEAENYYKRIAPLIGFQKLLDPNSTLDDLLHYLGFKGLGAQNLEELGSYELMPATPAEFQKLVATINNPLFTANVKLADFQNDGVLVSRLFAPKIVNYMKRNSAPGSKNPFEAGWRKLVRMRPTASSDARKKGIAEAYILFNFIEPLETNNPFKRQSGNHQVILVPTVFNTAPTQAATDSVFWMLYQKTQTQRYQLGYALNVNFDLPTQDTRDYFVPRACAECHGHDTQRGRALHVPPGENEFKPLNDASKGVYPYAKVNYLDTDQWYDMVEYDFPGTKQGPYDVVFDGNKKPPASAEYLRAFRILLKLNVGALEQNIASKRPGPADFQIKAVEKWLQVHGSNPGPIEPIRRALDMGGGALWSNAVPNDKLLLDALNRFCFRCHSSLRWNVFDKAFVLGRKDDIIGRIDDTTMPQGRVIPAAEKKALLDYLAKLK